ncbi:Taf12 protein [Hanseniaspora uvarum]|nr:Taf12 protein [Hanseniaspora uvarum]
MSSNSNTPVNRSVNQYVFNEDIKVTFATKQITLSNKFLDTVTTKIKQMKAQIIQEQDAEKKQQLMIKCQNIETMLQECLAEYKRKLNEYKNAQQKQQNENGDTNQQSNTNTENSANSNQNNQNAGNVSLKTYLTDEQKVHYVNINTQFQNKSNQLAQAFEQNKKQLELVLERLKNVIPETEKEEYEELLKKKVKCEQAGKSIQLAYKSLEAQIQDIKKRFYIKASETNPTLKKAMMMFPQIQAANAKQNASTDSSNKAAAVKPQTETQSTPVVKAGNATPTQAQNTNNVPKAASAVKPNNQQKTNAANNTANTSSNVPTQGILKSTISENTLLADAPKSVKPVEIPKTDFQKDPTQPTIFGGYLGSNPILSQPLNRVLGVNDDINNSTQQTQTTTHRKNVYVPTPQDHVLTKRKLRDLLKQYNGPSANIDGDVEELLLDLSDNFITQVVKFGGKVAKLRKSENLEVKDIKFALKKGFDLDL